MIPNTARDPYRRCETKCISFGDDECRLGHCRHDLGRGITLEELLGPNDAPEATIAPLIAPG